MDRPVAPRAERRRLTHVDRTGRPRMVDVSAKPADRSPRDRRGLRRLLGRDPQPDRRRRDAEGRRPHGRRARRGHGRQANQRAHPAVPSDPAHRPARPGRSGSRGRRPAHPDGGGNRRLHGRRDGGPDRGVRGRAHGLRYGQGRRARGGDPVDPARLEERWQERRVVPPRRRRCGRRGEPLDSRRTDPASGRRAGSADARKAERERGTGPTRRRDARPGGDGQRRRDGRRYATTRRAMGWRLGSPSSGSASTAWRSRTRAGRSRRPSSRVSPATPSSSRPAERA